MLYTVYKITTATGKIYVGATSNLRRRKCIHKSLLKCGNHFNTGLQKAYDENDTVLDFEVVSTSLSRNDAALLEQKTIRDLGSVCVNVNTGFMGGDTLSKAPDRSERVEKISEAIRHRMASLSEEDRIAKFGRPGAKNGMYGVKHSPESREKMSKAVRRNAGRNRGWVMSEEQKQAISARQSLRTGHLNSFYGKTHSEETKAKLSKLMKGNLPANSKEVCALGVVYPSMAECARCLGVSSALIAYRIKKHPNDYFYTNA